MVVVLAALPLAVGACGSSGDLGYSGQIRNDTADSYIVDVNFMNHVARVVRVPGHSIVELYGGSGVVRDAHAEAVIYRTDCTKVATVQLTNDLDTIYVDPQGHISVRAFRDVPYGGATDVGWLPSYEPGCPK